MDMMIFNNREIALISWGLVLLLALIAKADIRKSVWNVLKAATTPILLRHFLLICLYVSLQVFALKSIGLWDWTNIKATTLWLLTSAIVACSKTDEMRTDKRFFRKQVRATVSATVFLEYAVEFHPFGLIIEFVVWPVIALFSLVYAYTENDAKLKLVAKLAAAGLIFWAGFALYHSVSYVVANPQTSFTLATLYELTFPLVMTCLFLPFLYALRFYVVYEIALRRIGYAIPRERRSWALWQAMKAFKRNVFLLDRWTTMVMVRRPHSKDEIAASITDQLTRDAHEQQPHRFHHSDGWSPLFAQKFLKQLGLETNSYKFHFDDEWGASSPYIEFGGNIIQNNIAYYITGDIHAAKNLKIMININNRNEEMEALYRLTEASQVLTRKALKQELPTPIANAISMGKVFSKTEGNKQFVVSRQDWPRHARDGYDLKFEIQHLG